MHRIEVFILLSNARLSNTVSKVFFKGWESTVSKAWTGKKLSSVSLLNQNLRYVSKPKLYIHLTIFKLLSLIVITHN